ncbi:MAG: mechanosensitive ion channel family protein [Prevotellaceae bacterium]|jgi:MscS family membrane protein|nr:mechanosensitive ion channel family protein [Prevotellaceae bacterium]
MIHYLTTTTFLNNPLSEWIISLSIIVAAIILAKSIHWIFQKIAKLTSKTESKIDDMLFDKIEKPLEYAVIIFGFWLALKNMFFSIEIDKYINDAYKILVIINATWLVSRLVSGFINEYMQRVADKKSGSDKLDTSVIHTLNKVASGFIWVFGIVVALGHIGVNIGALITGLGIGGVAFALASQDTIKNIFAGVILFVDRPFRIGDRIKIDAYDGYVEDIGIRSVRIRTLDKRLITMSCSKVADSVIENISSEPVRRVVLSLGLTYDTTPEKMQTALNLLKGLPDIVTEIKHDISAYFNTYGDFSLNITLTYFIRKNADLLDTQSKVNLKILSLFNENGLNFAFPTQTVILEK